MYVERPQRSRITRADVGRASRKRANDTLTTSTLSAEAKEPEEDGAEAPRKRKVWREFSCLVLVLLVWLAVWAPRLKGPINFRWDASTYYLLGTALSEGRGYRLLSEPGEIEAIQYPPLLPAIVAVHQWLIGTTDYFRVGCVLRITYFVLSGVFLLMAYALARSLLSPGSAALVGCITALSFYCFLELSDILYAEMPFAVAATGFLLSQQNSHRRFFALASGVFATAAYLLRTAGLVLLTAWIAESLFRRRFRQAAIRLLISALPVVFWQGHVWVVTHSSEYLHPAYSYQRADYYYPNVSYAQNSRLIDPFRPELGQVTTREVGRRLVQNVTSVPFSLAESAIIPHGFALYVAELLTRKLHLSSSPLGVRLAAGGIDTCLMAVGFLALAGAALAATGRRWFLSLYFALNLALIIVTPWQNQFWRYLAPVAPLTLIFSLLALITAAQWLKRRGLKLTCMAGSIATMASVALIVLCQIATAIHLLRSLSPISYFNAAGHERIFKLVNYGREWHALDYAFEWVRRNAPPTAVVGTIVPHLAYLRTGHKAVLPPFESNPELEGRLLDEVPVSYLVVDTFGRPGTTERYTAPLIAQRRHDWQLVFTAPESQAQVYARIH